MTCFVVADDRFREHETGRHPECPQRLERIYTHLRAEGYLGDGGRLTTVGRVAADDAALTAVHPQAHVDRVVACASGGGGMLDADTVVSPASADVAREAAGSACALADAVLGGGAGTAGLALVRPPGHHATPQRAMGFCLFNTIAVVARHVQRAHGIERVMIVDFDVHHGNGTQDVFYDDPSVCFLSMHRYPFYPGTGAADERGAGAGEGTTVNLPLPGNHARADTLARFADAVAATADDFAPQVVLLSAGFDAYARDPIGGLGLDVDDFGVLTDAVAAAARGTERGVLVSLLEGGYHLEDLPKMAEVHADRLLAFGDG